MELIVTGATGFIGGAIARAALARGDRVTALYRGPRPTFEGPRWVTLEDWATNPPPRADAVIHAAALRHRHGIAPADYARTNLALTEAVLERSRGRVDRFVDVSSIAVYGWPARLPIDESFPQAPTGPYGVSKVETEAMVRASGIPWTIVQPSITYGPGDTNGMMDKILRMVARRRFVVPGLGRSRVQLVYIADLARLVLAAATADATRGERLICTYREPIAMRELTRLAARATGVSIPLIGPPVAALRLGALAFEAAEWLGVIRGEPPLTREKLATVAHDRAYRIDHMRKLLGDEPQVGYEAGFRLTAEALGLAPASAPGSTS